MKKNRTFILLLLFAFTFSNVGLPFTVHFCAMMEKMSKEKCMSCKVQNELTENSCCEKENKAKINFSSFNMDCCESKIAAAPLTDEFISSSFEIQKMESNLSILLITEEIFSSKIVLDRNLLLDASPPTETTTKLFLPTHNFRI